jgi:2,4-dienoyl-CoA reductase-like NADH-dependent reductase (Old Yellow Enzyme family)
MTAYPNLLSPVRCGPMELTGRIVSTAHQTGLVERHLPTDDLVAYHEARAAGGAAAIFLEATAVHPTGLLTSHTLGGYVDGIAAGYERLARAVQRHGTRLLVQLFHGGREMFAGMPRAPTVAPSAVPSARLRSEPRALTIAEIDDLVAGFALSAARARDGGLDGVEVSMAHGYLVAQFFNPLLNHRDDAYGRDRMRFAVEVLQAIRAEVARDIAVGVRLSANDLAPGGQGAADLAEIGAALRATGLVDYVSLALGHSASYPGSTQIVPPPPTPLTAIADHLTERPADGVRTIATTRIVDLEHAERLVASGRVDLVGMTRALIADPDLPHKARAGDAHVIECIGCNQACIGHYHAGEPIGCVVNPRTGRERRPAPIRRDARGVLVVGAGPAGVAAAVEAARCGDEVTLVEREPDIGGQLRLAGGAPAHREMWERWRRFAQRELESAGVAPRFGVEADAASLDGHEHVILATGALPFVPAATGPATVTAWDAIAHPDRVYGPALVADWGGDWAGLDAAELLAAAGVEVTLACAATVPGEGLQQYHRNLYLARLDEAGVRIRHHLALAEDARSLRHAFSGRREELGPVATLVLALGRRPADDLWSTLEGRPGATRVGDVLGPRTLEEAILEGFMAGRLS